MSQASRFHNIWIEILREFWVETEEPLCDTAADLSDFQAVRQSVVNRKSLVRIDDLRNSAQSPKRRGIEDSVAVLAACRSIIIRIGLTGTISAIKSAHSREYLTNVTAES